MSWVRAPPSTLKSVSLFIRLMLFLFGIGNVEDTLFYLNIISDMERKSLPEAIRYLYFLGGDSDLIAGHYLGDKP